MRLTWHIIAKDLRQNRWALGFWVFLFLAHLAAGFAFLHTDGADLDWIDQLRWASLLLTGFEFALGYLLALRWVQADGLSGTRMFWATRPISGGRLLAAKAAGLLLVFGLLPVLLWLPWWISAGQGTDEIAWLAVEMMGWQLLVIAPALLIGALTDDFGRAIMWSLVLVIAVLIWSVTGTTAAVVPGFIVRPFTTLWFCRMFVAGVLLVVGFAAIAAGQFLTRNTLRSMMQVGALALLVVLAGRVWDEDFSRVLSRPGEPSPVKPIPGLAEKIGLSVGKARISNYQYKARVADRLEVMRPMIITFEVSGLPHGLVLGGEHPVQELQWSGGAAYRSPERNHSFADREELIIRAALALPTPQADPETVRWGRERLKKRNEERAAQGLPPLDDFWSRRSLPPEPLSLGIRLAVTESTLARMRAEPPAYHTVMDAVVARWEIAQALPLKPGTRGTGSSRHLRVVNQDNWVTSLVETVPAYLRLGLFQALSGSRRSNPSHPVLYSVNQLTGDLDWTDARNRVHTAIMVGGVEIKWFEATTTPARWIRNAQSVIKDPEWVEHTQIVVMTATEVGRFTRDIRADRLAIQFPPESPAKSGAPEGVSATGEN